MSSGAMKPINRRVKLALLSPCQYLVYHSTSLLQRQKAGAECPFLNAQLASHLQNCIPLCLSPNPAKHSGKAGQSSVMCPLQPSAAVLSHQNLCLHIQVLVSGNQRWCQIRISEEEADRTQPCHQLQECSLWATTGLPWPYLESCILLQILR